MILLSAQEGKHCFRNMLGCIECAESLSETKFEKFRRTRVIGVCVELFDAFSIELFCCPSCWTWKRRTWKHCPPPLPSSCARRDLVLVRTWPGLAELPDEVKWSKRWYLRFFLVTHKSFRKLAILGIRSRSSDWRMKSKIRSQRMLSMISRRYFSASPILSDASRSFLTTEEELTFDYAFSEIADAYFVIHLHAANYHNQQVQIALEAPAALHAQVKLVEKAGSLWICFWIDGTRWIPGFTILSTTLMIR